MDTATQIKPRHQVAGHLSTLVRSLGTVDYLHERHPLDTPSTPPRHARLLHGVLDGTASLVASMAPTVNVLSMLCVELLSETAT